MKKFSKIKKINESSYDNDEIFWGDESTKSSFDTVNSIKPGHFKPSKEDIDRMVNMNFTDMRTLDDNVPRHQMGLELPDEDIGYTDKEKTSNSIVKFISKLLETREMAQVYHWTVKGSQGSHSSHLAFEEYYDSVIEHIDEFVEVYQGQYDIIEGYEIIDTSDTKNKEAVEYFKEASDFILNNRKCISDKDSHLHSIIDDILNVLFKTLYKLRFNR